MKLSKYFTLAEMTATSVREVDNTPSLEEAENLRFLCTQLLDPVRERFGPLFVTSGFRSREVNTIIRGSPTSEHIRGLAGDVFPIRLPKSRWREVMDFLLQSTRLPLDQAIYEYGRWLHIGTRPNGYACRREAWMIFKPGKYELWDPKDPRVK